VNQLSRFHVTSPGPKFAIVPIATANAGETRFLDGRSLMDDNTKRQ
jgi:hypothetical protein